MNQKFVKVPFFTIAFSEIWQVKNNQYRNVYYMSDDERWKNKIPYRMVWLVLNYVIIHQN